jgi:hypothetical protein
MNPETLVTMIIQRLLEAGYRCQPWRANARAGSPEGVGPLFCRNRSASVGVDKTKGIPTRRPVI